MYINVSCVSNNEFEITNDSIIKADILFEEETYKKSLHLLRFDHFIVVIEYSWKGRRCSKKRKKKALCLLACWTWLGLANFLDDDIAKFFWSNDERFNWEMLHISCNKHCVSFILWCHSNFIEYSVFFIGKIDINVILIN